MSSTSILKTAWHRASSIPSHYPFWFGVGLSGFKTSLSDLLVQKVVERRDEIDWRRNMAFAAFGFIYLGGVQYTLYVPLFSRLFPNAASFAAKSLRDKARDVRGMYQLGMQVVLDQMIHHPLLYFPAFYCTKELVMKKEPNVARCLQEYRHNMWEDLQALWKIWVPATIINFAFCPMYLRIPFVAGVSLCWTCILSAMRGGDVAHGDDMVGGAVTGATLTILREGLSELFTASPAELDRHMAHVIVSASGPDRVGWVSLLARTVANQGGNVTESKMVRLGEEFIILMHVAVPPAQKKDLVQALRSNENLKPLNIQTNSIARRKTGLYDKAVIGLRIHCIGEDK
jgi:predicted amino acid-binding ACT domain protein